MASMLASEISYYAEIMEDLEWEIKKAEIGVHDCKQNIQRNPESILSYDKERFYREAKEGLVKYIKEKEYWESVLNNLRDYEITDADTVSDIDAEMLDLTAADSLPEGKTWSGEVDRIKKKKREDAWVYKVPRNVNIVIWKDIETGEMAVRWATHLKSMNWVPNWKYQIIG